MSSSLKDLVREKYGEIAVQDKAFNASSCCGATGCGPEVYNIMADDYSQLEGYSADADLGLGCGLPTQFAQIKAGDTVLDLGSGAGNDCFVARAATGSQGKVIGIDFTDTMIAKARGNAEKLGYQNVEFRQGDIENMPVSSSTVDVVVSNCVLNLVPNKAAVFSEIYRVLKPGAHFSISDIVLKGELPEKWKQVAELYAGCISGAIQKSDYLGIIEAAGFVNPSVQKEKNIDIPDQILEQYLSPEEVEAFKNSGVNITSVTVFAQKPSVKPVSACVPGGGCC